MSPYLADLMKTNGALDQGAAVSAEVIAAYEGRVPGLLIELWSTVGIGAWKKGVLRLCLPQDFSAILALGFGADDDLSHEDCHVIAYGPFGTLMFWSERHWLGRIDLVKGQVRCTKLVYPEKGKKPDAALVAALYDPNPETVDVLDADEKSLFAQAKKALGPLEPGECYGFVPALALGGAPEIGAIKRMPAIEHFALLAQLQPFTLWDYLARPPGPVREIG